MRKINIKKYFIAFLFIFSIFFTQKSYAAEPILNVILPVSGFMDITENHWAAEEITELHRRGILAGYPDEKFHPERNITREEFATLAVRALKLDDEEMVTEVANAP